MAGHDDKSKRYISSLDVARVNGDWNELPELIRKVTKHAHNQNLLIQTATAEYDIITRIDKYRTSTASESSGGIQTVQSLVKEHEATASEELLQARTCLAWAAWVGAITDASALESFKPEDIRFEFDKWGQQSTQTWTKICLMKAMYIQGVTLLQTGDRAEANVVLDPAISWIELNQDTISTTPQLSYWCEQVLAQRLVSANDQAADSEEILGIFRLWSARFSKSPEKSPNVYGNKTSAHIVRFSIWRRYYSCLSTALIMQPSKAGSVSPRLRLSRELRLVESAYETELLRTQKFPRASETNGVIEGWVEQAVKNWGILCGPHWRDSDLGEGGRNAVTRNMLDVLYRAASKTFQSTLILRRLFQVHKSLTEFDLAYRCLDTYIELVERERMRSAKSQDPDANQESDETVLLTLSEGIFGLCSFGRGPEARKAYKMAEKIEDWVSRLLPEQHSNGETMAFRSDSTHSPKALQPQSLETVYRALGVAKAHWAKWTPFNEARTALQSDGLVYLRKACGIHDAQLDSIYALALLLSETREIDEAVQCVKDALQHKIDTKSATPSWVQARKLLPFWHLMALLLSSRQDFDTATRSCTAAFEQFSSSQILFGGVSKSDKSSSAEKDSSQGTEALIDDMECDELQRMIELQISHVALIELLDGPESALRGSNDLLALYSRLFARFDIELDLKKGQYDSAPPQSSAGTVKSFRGSIFSRKKHVPPPTTQPSIQTPAARTTPASTPQPVTRSGHPPIIHITHETGRPTSGRHHVLRRSHHETSASEKNKNSDKMSHRQSSEAATTEANSGTTSNTSQIPSFDNQAVSNGTVLNDPKIAEKHDTDPRSKQSVSEIPHNLTSHEKMPPPAGHSEQPPEQDVRLPTVNTQTHVTAPIPRFSKTAGQKHALTLLAKIWLVIGTLYRRENMFDDAREACDEASKAAAKIESLVSAANPSAKALTDPGWGGGGKSSDEIFADIFCEKAKLVLAIVNRREEEGQAANTDSLREAVELFEQCLMYFPNHAGGITGLSNLLLDYYEKKLELGKKVDDGRSSTQSPTKPQLPHSESFPEVVNGTVTPAYDPLHPTSMATSADDHLRKTPENLNRIAARDRAYGLLSSLTRLGSGWDDSEAWYALARAHQLGGEIEKAKSILWWCIDLEDSRPIRRWENLSCSGYVL